METGCDRGIWGRERLGRGSETVRHIETEKHRRGWRKRGEGRDWEVED